MIDQIPESIRKIIKNLRGQDGRCTNLPIFCVQKKERTYGFDPHWSDEFIWMDRSEEVYDEDLLAVLNKKDEMHDDIDYRFYKCYYRDTWLSVQPFLTEVGAQAYIDCNAHNLGGKENCRIYVESGWRNAEWQEIRSFLLTLDAKATD
jgi:hypothetical protein